MCLETSPWLRPLGPPRVQLAFLLFAPPRPPSFLVIIPVGKNAWPLAAWMDTIPSLEPTGVYWCQHTSDRFQYDRLLCHRNLCKSHLWPFVCIIHHSLYFWVFSSSRGICRCLSFLSAFHQTSLLWPLLSPLLASRSFLGFIILFGFTHLQIAAIETLNQFALKPLTIHDILIGFCLKTHVFFSGTATASAFCGNVHRLLHAIRSVISLWEWEYASSVPTFSQKSTRTETNSCRVNTARIWGFSIFKHSVYDVFGRSSSNTFAYKITRFAKTSHNPSRTHSP